MHGRYLRKHQSFVLLVSAASHQCSELPVYSFDAAAQLTMNAWSLAVSVVTVLAVLVLVVYEPVCTLPAYAWTPWRKPRKVSISYGWAPV